MNQSENKLVKNIEKKCTTIMIGSIARFEKIFSHLWDNDTAKADEYYEIWQQARHEILNFGNYQIREAVESMYKHFMNQDKAAEKYSYKFYFKDQNNQENK